MSSNLMDYAVDSDGNYVLDFPTQTDEMERWIVRVYENYWIDDPDVENKEEKKKEVLDTIDGMDPVMCESVIRKSLNIINDTPQSMRDWARYKWTLMEWEGGYAMDLFLWFRRTPPLFSGVDLDWNKIKLLKGKDLARAYYVVEYALVKYWIGPSLPTMYPK